MFYGMEIPHMFNNHHFYKSEYKDFYLKNYSDLINGSLSEIAYKWMNESIKTKKKFNIEEIDGSGGSDSTTNHKDNCSGTFCEKITNGVNVDKNELVSKPIRNNNAY